MELVCFEMHGTCWNAREVAGFGKAVDWLRYSRERFLTLLPAREQERKLRQVYRKACRLCLLQTIE